ncbi:hypothetical protein SAMN05216389_101126 [Oceanobacillus limi]|uniref:Uncharacterized protein n=1 Tax=Oceanobacillus limi TaxID=930131 RepID=A0A1H9Y1I1_9BACI|nr:CD3324 family protein [Oceanobacillus limi]SES62657.1 hypothetical protein SAMN05216389_101126 [Oceanobacillus limi]
MSYKKVTDLLPEDLLELIQKYVEGECIYIPIKNENKKKWGTNTGTKKVIKDRDVNIYIKIFYLA